MLNARQRSFGSFGEVRGNMLEAALQPAAGEQQRDENPLSAAADEPGPAAQLQRTAAWKVGQAHLSAEVCELGLPREYRAIGGALSDADGKPSALCLAHRVVFLTFCVVGIMTAPDAAAARAGMSAPNTLQWLTAIFHTLGFAALLLPVAELGPALRQRGTLGRLAESTGGGEIRAKTLGTIRRWRLGLAALMIGPAFLVVMMWATIFLPHLSEQTLWNWMDMFSNSLFFLVNVPLAIAIWWPSMRYASAIARDAVTKVVRAATVTDPSNAEEWQRRVARPAFELEAVFAQLSSGWGRGLAGMAVFCWSSAFGFMCNALNGACKCSRSLASSFEASEQRLHRLPGYGRAPRCRAWDEPAIQPGRRLRLAATSDPARA